MKFQTVHEDNRGTVALLTGGLVTVEEVTVFTTKHGYARGGCVHSEHDEHCVVIEGDVWYFVGTDAHSTILKAGDTLLIPKNTPHFFLSITDSVVLEWGATVEEKRCKHLPMRKIVMRINKKRAERG